MLQTKKLGYRGIGFSIHAPIGFNSGWHMAQEKLKSYYKEIASLKHQYKNELEIYTGLEIDYIKGFEGAHPFNDENLDFTVGSVHYVGQFGQNHYCCIDNTKEEFELGLTEIFNGDIKALVKQYYQSIIQMVIDEKPTIIGHLDLIKKLNSNNQFFDETESWYKKLVLETLDTIAGSTCIVEVNTRGFYKGITKEYYPSKWILQECIKRNIPITLNSDAHHVSEINSEFENVITLLKSIHLKSVYTLSKGSWVQTSISALQ